MKPRGTTHRAKPVSIEELSHHFHLPINEVASKLGVCVTVLKQRCREYGITRWPYRKVRKLDTLISSLKTLVTPEKLSPEQVVADRKRKLDRAVQTRNFLLSNPNSSAHLKLGKVKAKNLLNASDSPPRSPSVALDRLNPDCGSGSLSKVCSSAFGYGNIGTSLPQPPYHFSNTAETCQIEHHTTDFPALPTLPTLNVSHHYYSLTQSEAFSPNTISSAFSHEKNRMPEPEEGQVLVDFLGKMDANLAPNLVVNKEPEPKNVAAMYNTDTHKSGSRQRLWGLDLSSTYEPSQSAFWSPAVAEKKAEKYHQSQLGSACQVATPNNFNLCSQTPEGSNKTFGYFPSEPHVDTQYPCGHWNGPGVNVCGPFLSLSCAPMEAGREVNDGSQWGLGQLLRDC